jgi:RIO kinase 1
MHYSDAGSAEPEFAINDEEEEEEEEFSDEDQEWAQLEEEMDGGVETSGALAREVESRWAQVASRVELGPVVVSTAAKAQSGAVQAGLREEARRTEVGQVREKERADRATTELVLDLRTRLILFRLLSRGVLRQIHGCVSTGKEANVYHAFGARPDEELAVKIYKTSILVFKDRERYVTGEFRFRRGYSRHNPRKMVATWAEKEMRNLLRLQRAGVPAPRPVLLRGHVLLMEFLGRDGIAAPRLKDVELPSERWPALYADAVRILRRIYRDCHLVHADLSEYNLLYWRGSLQVIDVSQAVEHDHPHALDFLRTDVCNITSFFARRGAEVLPARLLFEYVTAPPDQDDEARLEELRHALERGDLQRREELQDQVWLQAAAAPSLAHLERPERLLDPVSPIEVVCPALRSLQVSDNASSASHKTEQECSDANDRSSSASSEEEKQEDPNGKSVRKAKSDPRQGLSKQEWKKKVKEEKREQRRNKIPKHIKKQKIKQAQRRKK